MPDNILYGVYRENAVDATQNKMVEMSKDRETARRGVVGRNSINKDKNVKYVGLIVQMEPWKVLGSFNENNG